MAENEFAGEPKVSKMGIKKSLRMAWRRRREQKPQSAAAQEPLPIWFFVGLILEVYGLIVLASGIIGDTRPTVLSELRPALWWGAVMLAAGAVFLLIGLRGRRSQP